MKAALGADSDRKDVMALTSSSQAPRASAAPGHSRARSSVRRLVLSLTRLVGIQARLLLLRAELRAHQILMALTLLAAAGVVFTLAAVSLYIGVFELLRLAMRPVWAFLLLGGVHLLVAALLLRAGRRLLFGHPDPAPPRASDAPPAEEAGT
jgi:hypothetical protein